MNINLIRCIVDYLNGFTSKRSDYINSSIIHNEIDSENEHEATFEGVTTMIDLTYRKI